MFSNDHKPNSSQERNSDITEKESETFSREATVFSEHQGFWELTPWQRPGFRSQSRRLPRFLGALARQLIRVPRFSLFPFPSLKINENVLG